MSSELHLAVEDNNILELQKLIASSAPNSLNLLAGKKELAPLHICAIRNRVECTKLLLDAGANPSVQDEFQVEPLHYAASTGATEVMDLLIDNGANLAAIDNMKRSPLECAVRYNRVNAVKKLLSNHVNVNSQNIHGGAALHQAADAGNVVITKLLIQHNANVNSQTESMRTPLHYAVHKGHLDIVNILIESSADLSAIESKAGETPLHRAAAVGNLNIVSALIKARADVNMLDFSRKTPLHKAAMAGHIEVIKLLISSGADVGIKDKGGKTPRQRSVNSATRSSFRQSKSLRSVSSPIKTSKTKSHEITGPKSIEPPHSPRSEALPSPPTISIQEFERGHHKDVLHIRSVLQAISKASEDTGTVFQSISGRYLEFIKRGDPQSKDLCESALNDIKQLHATLSSICQTLETSQEFVSQILYPVNETAEIPSEQDSGVQDNDVQYSYNEIDKASYTYLDSFQEQQIRDDTQIEQRKQVKTLNRSHSSNFSTRQSISAKKTASLSPDVSQTSLAKPSVPSVDLQTDGLATAKDPFTKNDRSDTEQSSELSSSGGRTPLSPKSSFSSVDDSDIPREKKLKNRIPSKTKLRLFPV